MRGQRGRTSKMTQQYKARKERVQQIAQAALELIAESGLRRFTTAAIAARVGITDGTIFRHFKNKEEIVLAAMDRLEETMFTEAFPTEGDPLHRLEMFFRRRAKLLGEQASVGRLLFSEQLSNAAGEEGLAKVKSWRARNMQFVGECLQGLQGSDWPEGLETSDIAVVIQGSLLTFAFQRTMSETTETELDLRVNRAWQTIERLFKS